MTIHLAYGGSAAHRTIGCPGNHEKSKSLPKSPTSAAAAEGSMHHEVQEKCRKEGGQPEDYLGLVYKEDGHVFEFTEDDLNLSEIAYNATERMLEEYDIDEFLVEPFVQLVPDVAGGSIDLLGLSADRKTILQLDYKFGSFSVSAEKNAQCAHYCISARADPQTADMWKDVERVIFCIIQPKLRGVSFTWETDIAYLDKFEKKYRKAMKSKQVASGTWCKFCHAEPYCDVKRASIVAASLIGARDLEDLQAGANMIEEVESWLKAMKEEMYWHLTRGVPVRDWKVVDKRATRKWIDTVAIDTALKKIAKKDKYVTELLSPAQMEKMLKRKKVVFDISEFVVAKSSGTTLAHESDPRPAVIASDVTGHLEEITK